MHLYLEDFSVMSAPSIAQTPCPILVAIIHFYFPVNGAGGETISIAVEGYCFCHVSVAILEECEAFLVRVGWKVDHHG
jgi:hypothetical protein